MITASWWTGSTLLDILGVVILVVVLARFQPRFVLRILPRWADDEQRGLILRFEIENVSSVVAFNPRAYFQVEPKTLEEGGELGEWLTFSDENSVEVFETTDRIYPGEVAAVERIHDVPDEHLVLHIALQVKLSFWASLLSLSLGRHQQTTTVYVTKRSARRAA